MTEEDGPLTGIRVLVPRARGQADDLAGPIEALGGEPVPAPTIEIRPGDLPTLRTALDELASGGFVAVCFTSANAVTAVATALRGAGRSPDALSATRVAAIGPGTSAALEEELGVTADIVPEHATTESLGRSFPPGEGRVLLPRADIATATLPAVLRERGYEPVEVDAYVTSRPDGLPEGVAEGLEAGEIDLVPFTSSSTVRNFVALLDGRPFHARVVSIGPVTSATCRELGIPVAVEATRHDLEGLVAALVEATRTS